MASGQARAGGEGEDGFLEEWLANLEQQRTSEGGGYIATTANGNELQHVARSLDDPGIMMMPNNVSVKNENGRSYGPPGPWVFKPINGPFMRERLRGGLQAVMDEEASRYEGVPNTRVPNGGGFFATPPTRSQEDSGVGLVLNFPPRRRDLRHSGDRRSPELKNRHRSADHRSPSPKAERRRFPSDHTHAGGAGSGGYGFGPGDLESMTEETDKQLEDDRQSVPALPVVYRRRAVGPTDFRQLQKEEGSSASISSQEEGSANSEQMDEVLPLPGENLEEQQRPPPVKLEAAPLLRRIRSDSAKGNKSMLEEVVELEDTSVVFEATEDPVDPGHLPPPGGEEMGQMGPEPEERAGSDGSPPAVEPGPDDDCAAGRMSPELDSGAGHHQAVALSPPGGSRADDLSSNDVVIMVATTSSNHNYAPEPVDDADVRSSYLLCETSSNGDTPAATSISTSAKTQTILSTHLSRESAKLPTESHPLACSTPLQQIQQQHGSRLIQRLMAQGSAHVVPSRGVPSHVVPSHGVPSHGVPSHGLLDDGSSVCSTLPINVNCSFTEGSVAVVSFARIST